MKWTLEVVTVPVSDMERAKTFYEQVGFDVDIDHRISEDHRLVQLTPPGSGCSIQLGRPTETLAAGALQGLLLVVPDVLAAHAELVERGVDVSEVLVFDGGSQRPHREGDDLNNVGFVYFNDPDGNGWGVQEISSRG
jgi:catechol 2,3-dioxygenase-like lactoylglutathione lyase family enzyme